VYLPHEYAILTAKTSEEFERFWSLCKPHLKAILDDPAAFSPAIPDDYTYFLDGEYLDAVKTLFERETDPLVPAFFCRDGEVIGFVSYVIYTSEDGKCFILEYNIDAAHRNQGLGKLLFELLCNHVSANGAKYFRLNCSNADNERFWRNLGFAKVDLSEEGKNPEYTRPIP